MTDRKPTTFLNYCGGPSARMPRTSLLYPVTAEFDGKVTRVGFSLIAPAEVSA